EKQEITIEKEKCNKQKCITIVKALQLFGELSVGDRKRVDWVHHEQSSFEVRKPDMKCNFHNPVRPEIRQCPHLLSRPVSVTPLWFSILRFFQILRGFFNELHTSIRLLRLTGLKPSFSNIYSQIDLILTWQILFFNEKIWAIRAQCKASCKHGTKPRHSSTQGGSIVHFRLIGTCPPIIRFLAILLLQCSYKVDPLCMDSWLSAYPMYLLCFHFINVLNYESLGNCTGPIQEFGDDGFMIWMAGSIIYVCSKQNPFIHMSFLILFNFTAADLPGCAPSGCIILCFQVFSSIGALRPKNVCVNFIHFCEARNLEGILDRWSKNLVLWHLKVPKTARPLGVDGLGKWEMDQLRWVYVCCHSLSFSGMGGHASDRKRERHSEREREREDWGSQCHCCRSSIS
ncbi:hypothetical protein DVH24_025310, partial [Malus domestica]